MPKASMPKAKPVSKRLRPEPFAPEPGVTAKRVIDRLTGEDRAGPGKFASLPNASSLFESTKEMQHAVEVLETAHNLKDAIKEMEEGEGGLKSQKDELTAISVEASVPGFRHGNLCVSVATINSARFDKELFRDSLIDAGMPPGTVRALYEAAHVQQEPYYRVELRKLD